MDMITKYLIAFLISMVPLIELRGAVPYALAIGLPVLPTYIVCILGNMLPVPFIEVVSHSVNAAVNATKNKKITIPNIMDNIINLSIHQSSPHNNYTIYYLFLLVV